MWVYPTRDTPTFMLYSIEVDYLFTALPVKTIFQLLDILRNYLIADAIINKMTCQILVISGHIDKSVT